MRKFLVVVDSTPECMNALRFAARRAAHTGGGVVMLYVIEPDEFQHWAGVAAVIAEERRDEAEARLAALADEVGALSGVIPEFAIREGAAVDEALAQMEEDPNIAVLVLGAAEDGDGPGPLVSALVSKRGGRLPLPVTVVPGCMTLAEIDDVT